MLLSENLVQQLLQLGHNRGNEALGWRRENLRKATVATSLKKAIGSKRTRMATAGFILLRTDRPAS